MTPANGGAWGAAPAGARPPAMGARAQQAGTLMRIYHVCESRTPEKVFVGPFVVDPVDALRRTYPPCLASFYFWCYLDRSECFGV